jgi:hypothetical protein
MPARYLHIPRPMLQKVTQLVGDALWKPPRTD